VCLSVYLFVQFCVLYAYNEDINVADKFLSCFQLQQVEGDAFTTQGALEENIKELKEKLEAEENKSSEFERVTQSYSNYRRNHYLNIKQHVI